jgi:predicted porin
MKKILLGGSALASVALLSAGANAADPLKLSIGGYFQAYAVYQVQDDDPGEPGQDRRNFDLKREAEVHFKGETKLDNGLTVGVDVQLEAETCGDQIDESYLYFSGGWGRVIIGSENNAAYLLQVGAPAVDGNFDGTDPNFRLVNIGTNAAGRYNYAMVMDGDSEKFTYLSPVFAGFQAGISYSPGNCEETSASQVRNCVGSFGGMEPDGVAAGLGVAWQDVIELGARYNGQFGPVKISVGGGYGFGERNGLRTTGVGTATTTFEDRREWNVGAQFAIAGFSFGGGYYRDNNGIDNVGSGAARGTADNDFQMWQVGVNYGIGAFTVGASYAFAKQPVVGGTDKMDRVLVGGSYTYGPGMTFRGSVQYHDLDGPGRGVGGTVESADNSAWAFVLGTHVNF